MRGRGRGREGVREGEREGGEEREGFYKCMPHLFATQKFYYFFFPFTWHLFCLAQCLSVGKHVQVCENSHHLGKAMGLEDVQKLKCIHFKTMVTIDQQQYLEETDGWVCHSGQTHMSLPNQQTHMSLPNQQSSQCQSYRVHIITAFCRLLPGREENQQSLLIYLSCKIFPISLLSLTPSRLKPINTDTVPGSPGL